MVHADRLLNSPTNGAVHESTNNSVLFEFSDVADLEAVFQGKKAGHVYSRSSSNSAVALQKILAELEGGIDATVFTTGMAAISAVLLSLLKAGDHIVCSQFLFGNTRSFMDTLSQFSIQVTYVDVTEHSEVQGALTENTRMVFCESIANPVTQVSDIANIGQLCKEHDILFILDNTMTPSAMLDSASIGVNIVASSLTKYVAGHGNVLGGVAVDMGNFNWESYPNILEQYKSSDPSLWGLTQLRKKGLRDLGGTLAPQSAHTISVGLETLNMRIQATCNNAVKLAEYLQSRPEVTTIHYPGLKVHPQHLRAKDLFNGRYGGILSFELAPEIDIRAFINHLNLLICATHLGDTRTLVLPVATTIFYENGPQEREKMGISDSLIRVSVGIEDIEDLIDDFEQAFLALV